MSDHPDPRTGGPGRLVLVGLDGQGLTPEFQTALRAGRVGGLILFREDIPTLGAGADLIARARRLSPHPLLVGLDEEGGFVSQIDGVPLRADGSGDDLMGVGGPAPGALGNLDDPAITESVHEAVGRVLHAMGADIVFGPLLDVNTNPENPVIGRRSFGSDPDTVIRHGRAALRGLARAGVVGCAKHFPGHGAAGLDSHTTLPEIGGTVPDLPVFAATIRDGVPMLMTAHVHYPDLDPTIRPATRSRSILHDLLRQDLGFDGIVVSDALEMTGFAGTGGDDGILEALEAGVDLFLVARGQARGLAVAETLSHGAARVASAERLDGARDRLDRLIATRPVPGHPDPAGAGPVSLDPGHDMARVVGEARTVLEGAHAAALGRPRAPSFPLRGPWRVLLPSGVPRGFLDPETVRAGLADLPGSVEVGEETASLERLPTGTPGGGGTCLILSFVRGSRGRDEAHQLRAAAERWRESEQGRGVVALAAADVDPHEDMPEAWGSITLSGSHRTGLAAAATVLAAWTGS